MKGQTPTELLQSANFLTQISINLYEMKAILSVPISEEVESWRLQNGGRQRILLAVLHLQVLFNLLCQS